MYCIILCHLAINSGFNYCTSSIRSNYCCLVCCCYLPTGPRHPAFHNTTAAQTVYCSALHKYNILYNDDVVSVVKKVHISYAAICANASAVVLWKIVHCIF